MMAFRRVVRKSGRIPIRMRRPAMTGKALRLFPLLKASGTYPSGVERIPLMSAGAGPEVILARRPAAEGTSNARAGWLEIPFLLNLAI